MNVIFPDTARVAMVFPIDKKTDDKKKFYRRVSVANIFSKVYKIMLKNELVLALSDRMSPFISAYRKGYSTQHVLERLIEKWCKNLDDDYIVGGILMDLSKAFYCISHYLLIAKLDNYDSDRNSLKHINSYLNNIKQCVRINNISSDFNDIM